jgi:hypothetical protein
VVLVQLAVLFGTPMPKAGSSPRPDVEVTGLEFSEVAVSGLAPGGATTAILRLRNRGPKAVRYGLSSSATRDPAFASSVARAKQVSDLSHAEPGWELVEEGETIPYEAALIAPREILTPTSDRLAAAVAERYGVPVDA